MSATPLPDMRSPLAMTLRVRLLLGLGLGVLVPFVLFYFVGNAMLRRGTKDLGRFVLEDQARAPREHIGTWLAKVAALADFVAESSDVRALLSGDSELTFEDWYVRTSDRLGALGRLLIVDAAGHVLFLTQEGPANGAPRRLEGEPWDRWLGIGREAQLRFHAPIADPLAPEPTVSSTRDPARYVLPLVRPLRDDADRPRGAFVCLLPFREVQDAIENRRRLLVDERRITSGQVFLLDRDSGKFLLHTDRRRIGSDADPALRALEGYAEDAGAAVAAWPVLSHASLAWSVGAVADRGELFEAVRPLGVAFLVLVLCVLGATLGIATVISVAATRSLGRLERVTEELGSGALDARAEIAGPREVRALGAALNTMAAQLERDRERLKIAERDRAWTAMARQVAHEIKNPLQPVRLHAELIQRLLASEQLGAVERERGSASASVILRQVEALRRIVADFSAFAEASLPMPDKARFRAADVVQDLVELYAVPGSENAVVFDDASGAAEILGSPLRLQQVLVNLIKNAIEASFGGETVEVVAWVEGDRWIAEVRDRGPGLPAGGGAIAFEPSFSTKPGGTGLGLAICQRNLDAMGGRIQLLPREGRGVRARVDIPLAAPAPPPPRLHSRDSEDG